MALEAVVRHDAAQIRVADEKDTKQIVNLALVPVGAVVEPDEAGYRRCLVGVRLDADPGVVPDAEQVVDDLEALVPRGEVDGRDVAELGELGSGVVCVGMSELGHGD